MIYGIIYSFLDEKKTYIKNLKINKFYRLLFFQKCNIFYFIINANLFKRILYKRKVIILLKIALTTHNIASRKNTISIAGIIPIVIRNYIFYILISVI